MGTGRGRSRGRADLLRILHLMRRELKHCSIPRPQGFQPSSSVVHTIPSLAMGVTPDPFGPTRRSVGSNDFAAVVEAYAVFEPHVAFINELNAGTATARQQHQESQRRRSALPRQSAPKLPAPERHCSPSVPFSHSAGNSLTKVRRKRRSWCYGRGVFTGLVTAIGELTNRQPGRTGSRVRISCPELGQMELGESIAVNGTCLTVATIHGDGFEGDVSPETLKRTTLGRLPSRSMVNLERALRVGDRLGGHWVSGHIDGVVRLIGREPVGGSLELSFDLPQALVPYVAPKGSVAIDGVSLTVNSSGNGSFSVMLIPHTRGRTTLERATTSTEFNLEVDVLARYVVHAMNCLETHPTTPNKMNPTTTTSSDAGLTAALGRAGIL
jgi:riboflavin synthase